MAGIDPDPFLIKVLSDSLFNMQYTLCLIPKYYAHRNLQ